MSDQVQRFQVVVVRRDQSTITANETNNIEEARVVWKELTDKWNSCITESKPFELDCPAVLTSFDPGLIYEIVVSSVTTNIDSNNPYKKAMQKHGFSNSFPKTNSSYNGILDNGFKAE